MKSMRSLPIILALALPVVAAAEGDTRGKSDRSMKQKSADKSAKINAHVIPIVAGIESADKATGVLYELAGSEQLTQKQAQETVELAQDALDLALDRATALDDVAGLSSDAKNEAERATTRLRDARSSLQDLEEQVSQKRTRVSRDDAERIREQAADIHENLSEAEDAIERIARAYDVPTDLEFGS